MEAGEDVLRAGKFDDAAKEMKLALAGAPDNSTPIWTGC